MFVKRVVAGLLVGQTAHRLEARDQVGRLAARLDRFDVQPPAEMLRRGARQLCLAGSRFAAHEQRPLRGIGQHQDVDFSATDHWCHTSSCAADAGKWAMISGAIGEGRFQQRTRVSGGLVHAGIRVGKWVGVSWQGIAGSRRRRCVCRRPRNNGREGVAQVILDLLQPARHCASLPAQEEGLEVERLEVRTQLRARQDRQIAPRERQRQPDRFPSAWPDV